MEKIKSYKLTILKEDDSIYWVEYFNSKEALDHWFEEEKTRPYWFVNYKSEIEEIE